MRHSPTQRGTLGHLAGGHTLFDRQSPKDDSELGEKLPELFDIHVMFFADTSSEGITALQMAFGLERGVAEKLVADVPVMVKRAASPEVADALLDLLNNLGAQVVLMPSTTTPSIIPPDSNGGLLGSGPALNGIDLRLPQAPAARGGAATEEAPLGARSDDDDEWRSGLSSRPPPPAPLPAPLPIPVASAAVEAESFDQFAGDRRSAPLELAQLEPTPRVFSAQLRQRVEAASAADAGAAELADAPPLPPATSLRAPPPPPPQSARSASQRKLDLGLGSVPPLPSPPVGGRGPSPSVSPAKPPPAPAPRPRGAQASQKAPSGAGFPAQPGPRPAGQKAPSGGGLSVQLSALADDPTGADLQVATPGAGDPYWSAKRRAQLGVNATANAAAPAATPAGTGTGPGRSATPIPEREARPRVETPAAGKHRAKFGALAAVVGIALITLSVRLDHSIFSGSATVGWVLLQGLALFAIAAGVVRMRK